MNKKAVFLDRDGVINIDSGYVFKKEDFVFVPFVFEALRDFQNKGYILIIITNQSGIGRGYYSKNEFLKLNDYMMKQFKKHGILISKVYYCPHAPNDNCPCRKPKPKMILDAQKDFSIDLNLSWLIGDSERDIEAGINAGVKNLILIGNNDTKATFKISSLQNAIEIVV